MSELYTGAIKLGFLALLWLFVVFVVVAIKTDLFGEKLPSQKPPRNLGRRKPPTILRILDGSQAGLSLEIGEELRIGRSADCHLIMDDDYVSTKHARLHSNGKDVVLTDLGSTNGTFVNQMRISIPTAVTPTDTIRIGRTSMRVEA